MNEHSGSGVAFSRNPTTGAKGLVGEYLARGQGEEIVAGRETAEDVSKWKKKSPSLYSELESIAHLLEREDQRIQELEFTVEDSRLYFLQSRPAKLTEKASVCFAVSMVEEGVLNTTEAIDYLQSLGFSLNDFYASSKRVVESAVPFIAGLPVGGGAVSARVVFSSDSARLYSAKGDPIVFIANETSPELLPLMKMSAALVTMRGGMTSHASVVAREMRLPCVVGLGGRVSSKQLEIGERVVHEGDWITVDGDKGEIFLGDVCVDTQEDKSDYVMQVRTWWQENQGDIL